MLKQLSAVTTAVLLAGCVSTNTPDNNAGQPSPVNKVATADFHKHAASAEQIAQRLWHDAALNAKQDQPTANKPTAACRKK